MYYVPNMLIRRSRAPSDVFTVTLQTTGEYTYKCTPRVNYGDTLNVDWGDGSSPETWGYSQNNISQKHYYSTAGTYVVSFWGMAKRLIVSPDVYNADPVKQCNYNWGALPVISIFDAMFTGCAYLVSPLTSLPEGSHFPAMFRGCTRLPIASGFVLPTTAVDCSVMFYLCEATDYDINDLGSSFPLLTNIWAMFQDSYFYGDAAAFKNKCAASVNYADAFRGSRCTNIPT